MCVFVCVCVASGAIVGTLEDSLGPPVDGIGMLWGTLGELFGGNCWRLGGREYASWSLRTTGERLDSDAKAHCGSVGNNFERPRADLGRPIGQLRWLGEALGARRDLWRSGEDLGAHVEVLGSLWDVRVLPF